MKRITFLSLCSLILLVPACGWFNNRRRCSYPVAPAPVCCPATESYAPAEGAYYNGQGAPVAQAEVAYDNQGRPISAAASIQPPPQPDIATADMAAAPQDYDYDADEDDQDIQAMEAKRSTAPAQQTARIPVATTADEDDDIEEDK